MKVFLLVGVIFSTMALADTSVTPQQLFEERLAAANKTANSENSQIMDYLSGFLKKFEKQISGDIQITGPHDYYFMTTDGYACSGRDWDRGDGCGYDITVKVECLKAPKAQGEPRLFYSTKKHQPGVC